MAKTPKTVKNGAAESGAWSITILTLAISCAAMATLIDQNQDLRQQNYQLAAQVTQ